MRALGRDGWLLCRWPLEESIHAAIVLPPDTYTPCPHELHSSVKSAPRAPVPATGAVSIRKGSVEGIG
jgi:hypothetical protein